MTEKNNNLKFKTKPNIGNRFTAGLVDYIIIYAFFYFFIYNFGEPLEDGGYGVSGLPAFVPVLFWGIMTVGVEQWFGATIGNLLVGLKPISIREPLDNSTFSKKNEKLTFGQSLKRHLLDPIDMFFFGIIAIVTIKNTEKNQRLGDLWGNTIVINTLEDK